MKRRRNSMCKRLKRTFSTIGTMVLLMIISQGELYGQKFPVDLTSMVSPPYSVYYEDYYSMVTNNWQIAMTFQDFNEPSREVALKLSIEGEVIRIQSRQDVLFQNSVTLVPGVPHIVSGNLLEPYLKYESITISGYPRSVFEQSGKLPEGVYTFCAEVVDKYSGEILSPKVCTQVWIQLNDEPIINLPFPGMVQDPILPMNIVFQWQPGSNLSVNPMATEYQLTLFEISSKDVPPQNAVKSGKVVKVFQSDWMVSTMLVYDISYPSLQVGKSYTYIVQAKDVGGKDLFKNNGYSTPGYFYYGYPEGGRILLLSPSDSSSFGKYSQQLFKWGVPDNLVDGQHLIYKLRIVESERGLQSQEALDNGIVWHSFESPLITTSEGYGHFIDPASKPLPKDKQYVWQVTAHTGEQDIAASAVYAFDSPPILEEFLVGRSSVYVTKLHNNDLNQLSGTGMIKINDQGKMVSVRFENIQIKLIGGIYVLESGVVRGVLDSVVTLNLYAENQLNGAAAFEMHAVRLSNEGGLEVQGEVLWPFPLATTSSNVPVIRSENRYFRYSNFNLAGAAYFVAQSFELSEPFGFVLELDESSEFNVGYDKFEIYANGTVRLPDKIKSSEGFAHVRYPFSGQNQLFLMHQTSTSAGRNMEALRNTNVSIAATDYIIDFSEETSPGKQVGLKNWKGIYFKNFMVHYGKLRSAVSTLNFDENIDQFVDLDENPTFVAWVSGTGLDLVVEKGLTSSEGVKFNTFPSELKRLKLKILNNNLISGGLFGSIKIPVLSETKEFTYSIPVSEEGYTNGYLDEELDGQSFVFNEAGGAQRLLIQVKRAVFEEKNRIRMTLDLEWPSFQTRLTNLDGFMVWGNYNVGFYSPNGISPLLYQTQGKSSGYDLTIDYVGAGRDKNLYSFGISASIQMGEDIAGDGGPPKINAFSIAKCGLIPENYIPAVRMEDQDGMQEYGSLFSIGNDTELDEDYEVDIDASLYNLTNTLGTGANHNVGENGFELQLDSAVSDVEALTTEQIIRVIDLVMVFASADNKVKLQNLKEKILLLDQSTTGELLKDFKEGGFSLQTLLDKKIDQVIEKLNGTIQGKIDALNGKIEGFVVAPVANGVDQVNVKIEEGIDQIMDQTKQLASRSNSTALLQLIESTRVNVKESVTVEFREAVVSAVKTNITDKVTQQIDTIVAQNVTQFIGKEVRGLGDALLQKELSAEHLQALTANTGILLDTITSQAFRTFKSVNGKGVQDAVTKTISDSYENINWQRIGDKIKAGLANSADTIVKEQLIRAVSILTSGNENALALAEGIMSNVDLDFNNVGQKLKNGEIGQIVSFDPSYVKVQTKVAKFEGYLNFTKADPVWGDSWQAMITGEFYKPKKFTARAKYLNGKVDGYNYWFLELAVPSGLAVPLVPGVLNMDGVGGKVFSHMKYDAMTKTYTPYEPTKFGAGLDLYCLDPATKGQSMRLNATAELTIYEDYFNMEIRGNIGVGFKEAGYSTDYSHAKVEGSGFLGYNSRDAQLLGEFTVATHMDPVICAGGTMGVNVRDGYWNVYVGKKTAPVYAKLLCMDAISMKAWFDISNTRMELGLQQDISLWARSPWLRVLNYDVQPYLGFEYHFLAEAALQFKPTFKIEEAALDLSVYAAIGTLYKNNLTGKQGDWVLAGAYFGGGAKYKNTESEAYIAGHLEGAITLIGISIGVDMEMHKDLKPSI